MIQIDQGQRYAGFYDNGWHRVQRWMRADVRYRCRRLREALREHGIDTSGKRVLVVGFGSGDLLASFPPTCSVVGAEISPSAIMEARRDPRFGRYRAAEFYEIGKEGLDDVPAGPFDIVLSSHTLEHVPDPGRRGRGQPLQRQGVAVGAAGVFAGPLRTSPQLLLVVLVIFVPIEPPDYVPYHLRNYSVQSIAERVVQAGLRPLLIEGSMYVDGHLWHLLTIPSRRQWPLVRYAVDAARLSVLCCTPYRAIRTLDALLYRAGFRARQALVIARG